jgi:hypothetical protein
MKQFNIGGREFVGVEVPEEIIILNCEIELPPLPFGDPEVHFFDGNMSVHSFILPVGSYKIIGLVNDLNSNNIRAIMGTHPLLPYLAKWVEIKFRNHLTDNTLIIEKIK